MGDEELVNSSNDVVSEEVKTFGLSKLVKIATRNRTFFCPNGVPSVHEYLSGIDGYGISLLVLGAMAVIVVLIIFIDTLRYIMRNSPPRVKAHSAFVIGVYPVVALATYCAIMVPRSHLLAEAVTQGTFMAAMYQLFCLFVAYCGGEAELIRKVKPASLNPRVGPCCCWPCCCCLPMLDINKNRVLYLRLMVLQLPVLQGLVYMALLVMWAERESLYEVNYMYFQPVIVLSILFGIWAMVMTVHMLRDLLKHHSMLSKFVVLQLVLMFGKLQALVMRVIIALDVLPCDSPITPTVYANLIYNSLILLEMVFLGFIAGKIYKRSLPDVDVIPSLNSNVNKICVVSNHITTIGAIMACENNNNNVFVGDKNKEDISASNLTPFSDPVEDIVKMRL